MRFYARRPLEYLGKQYDRGQLMPELNARNDEKLIRLGYVAEVQKDTVIKECGDCSAKFIGEDERNGHFRQRHRETDLTPDEEDAREERQERMLEEVAPLYLDQTKASRESAPAEVNTKASKTKATTKGRARAASGK